MEVVCLLEKYPVQANLRRLEKLFKPTLYHYQAVPCKGQALHSLLKARPGAPVLLVKSSATSYISSKRLELFLRALPELTNLELVFLASQPSLCQYQSKTTVVQGMTLTTLEGTQGLEALWLSSEAVSKVLKQEPASCLKWLSKQASNVLQSAVVVPSIFSYDYTNATKPSDFKRANPCVVEAKVLPKETASTRGYYWLVLGLLLVMALTWLLYCLLN